MAARERNELLAGHLREAGLSYAALARKVDVVGAQAGHLWSYDRSSVARWVSGVVPSRLVGDVVAQVLSERLGRLLTAGDIGLAAAEVPPSPTRPVEEGLVWLGRAEGDPARRDLLLGQPYWPQRPLEGPVPPPAARLERRATAGDLTAVRAQRQHFYELFERQGSGPVRSALRTFIMDDVLRYLLSRASDDWSRRMRAEAAQVVHLLGLATFDAGHSGLANRYYESALLLARQGGAPLAESIVLRTLGNHARQVGQLPAAERFFARASTCAPGHAVRGFVLTGRAAVYAADGDGARAARCLEQAETCLADAAQATDPYERYDLAAVQYQRAVVLHLLGRNAEAVEAARVSVRLREKEHRRPLALSLVMLTDLQMRIGHLDAATDSWRRAVAAADHVDSPRLRELLRDTARRMAAHTRHSGMRGAVELFNRS
ncbi:hypothetical protein [Streptomyces sp. NPDC088785]|uniref:hypothetical protein n=1 Tax=Streptomyces sp. NPDC088785 TaxID=3365897 RepID=UPI003806E1C5